MRGLVLQDVFRLSEIIDEMGIELDLKELMDKIKTEGGMTERVGGQIALMLMKKLHKSENKMYEFISELSGDSVEEVKKYRPKKMINFFYELVNDEDFADFFRQA